MRLLSYVLLLLLVLPVSCAPEGTRGSKAVTLEAVAGAKDVAALADLLDAETRRLPELMMTVTDAVSLTKAGQEVQESLKAVDAIAARLQKMPASSPGEREAIAKKMAADLVAFAKTNKHAAAWRHVAKLPPALQEGVRAQKVKFSAGVNRHLAVFVKHFYPDPPALLPAGTEAPDVFSAKVEALTDLQTLAVMLVSEIAAADALILKVTDKHSLEQMAASREAARTRMSIIGRRAATLPPPAPDEQVRLGNMMRVLNHNARQSLDPKEKSHLAALPEELRQDIEFERTGLDRNFSDEIDVFIQYFQQG
jgi:hypothetical protein